jgi:hypothetical protein
MGKSHGQNHPMSHAKKMVCPYGEFDFIKTGDVGSNGKSFKTSDGEEHASGQTEAEDVTCEMYMTDQAKVQALLSWHAAFKHALPGYKVPATFETLALAEAPGSVWQVEWMFPKSVKESAGDENTAGAATLTIVFSVFNAEKTV